MERNLDNTSRRRRSSSQSPEKSKSGKNLYDFYNWNNNYDAL